MSISERLKKRREYVGLTLKDVAKIVGVAESTINRWENGEIQKLDMNKIEALSRALKCTPAYLMGWEDIDTKYQLIELFDQATDEQKAEILSFAEFRVKKNNA